MSTRGFVIVTIWLRSLLFYIYLFAFVTLCATAILLSVPFTTANTRYLIGKFWSKTTLWVLDKLCAIQFEVLGAENIPGGADASLIVLGKHQSAWETIAYPSIFPRQLCFVFKRELLFLPFFGWALASVNMIHINRGDREASRAIVASQGRKHLSEGKWIAIFPEGTRTPVGSFKPYRRGGVRLAVSTQTNILPVAQNSGRLWGKNSILKRPGLITVSILPVISVEGKSEDELQQALETSIETEMQRLG